MEIYNRGSLAELGMVDHGFTNHWSISSADGLSTVLSCMAASTRYHDHNLRLFTHEHSMEMSPDVANNSPMNQQKSIIWSSSNGDDHVSRGLAINSSSYSTDQIAMVKPKEEKISSPITLSFSPDMMASNGSSDQNQKYVFKASQGNQRVCTKARLSQAQDHIMAERNRRKMLNQRFIALSALLPGLKKMDKASVLGDAIKHLKQLQEKATTLEEEARKNSMERVVYVKKCTLGNEGHENSSSGGNSSNDEPLPEVEAKVCNKEVLVRVHCERRKGIHAKTIAEIEKLRLTVINHSAMTLGTSTLDITVTARMEEEFTMPIKDLVKHLRSALKKFM